MTAALYYLWRHRLVIAVIGGALISIAGTTVLAYLVGTALFGDVAGVAAAASVGGAMASAASWRWSQMAVIEEPK
jgi:hypothetical protein